MAPVTLTTFKQSDDYLNAFGANPSPDISRAIQLPTRNDLQPPIPAAQLLDPNSDLIDRQLEVPAREQAFLLNTYGRVAHPVLDQNQADKLDSFYSCHNGLYAARHGEWLESQDLYHLADRLVTWAQDQPNARLGNRSSGNWWILPELYAIRVGSEEATPTLASEIYNSQQRQLHRTLFDQARFTIHMVNLSQNHWALMIYQPSTGHSWYLDSIATSRNQHSKKARTAFLQWLAASNRPAPATKKPRTVKLKGQKDTWSCGLHTIINTMAFIRHEVLGWHNVVGWERLKADDMLKELVGCLHELMGLRRARPACGHTPTQSPALPTTKPAAGTKRPATAAPPTAPAAKRPKMPPPQRTNAQLAPKQARPHPPNNINLNLNLNNNNNYLNPPAAPAAPPRRALCATMRAQAAQNSAARQARWAGIVQQAAADRAAAEQREKEERERRSAERKRARRPSWATVAGTGARAGAGDGAGAGLGKKSLKRKSDDKEAGKPEETDVKG
ncbi:hypothetical protein NEMBOFW57_005597 [Staphylotrichum longicolle]|uniref:Ubiquitin-like protease family profile domain-containing protein n=1 Tax=Staphylotrichum longicolle TaxID=669026 RepID=A0AAD4HYP1_9PEZI|nr:hypothetical protein NEMBOFW57_005597 [Staphylotrichum longicolle]